MEIAQICKKLLIKDPFYGVFMLGLDKQYSDEIPTLGVRLTESYNVQMIINKEFLNSLTEEMALAILKHELNHILLKHIFYGEKEYPNHELANYAADCSVNSYIPELQTSPWVYPKIFELPDKEGMRYYYNRIPFEKIGNSSSLIDSHDGWGQIGELSEPEKKIVENQIDSRAKETAEYCKSRLPGSLPGHLIGYLDSLFKIAPPVFNWKGYFRRVIGNSIKSFIKSTRYRPSYRFEGSPGNVVKYKPKILIAIDTSGSVSNEALQEFFSEVHNVYNSGVAIEVVEFDTCICHKFNYKGKKSKIEIHGRGGTDASEVVKYYKNNNKFSSLIIFTDGYLDTNFKAKNLIWVISPNGAYSTRPGISIYMDNKKQ